MKKFTHMSFALLMIFLLSGALLPVEANNKSWVLQPGEIIIDKSLASDNLPANLVDHGANRGASFNGDYIFVASRIDGHNIYYWDVANPEDEPQTLDVTGISGGTFPINDVATAGEHIFVTNMVMPGMFKVYHWDDVNGEPSVLIEYDSGDARLGDAFSVIGDPDVFASVVVSAFNTNNFYIWEIENGTLVSETPDIVEANQLEGTVNFARVTQVPGEELYVVSGSSIGIALIDEELNLLAEIPSDFFPYWSMYPHVFNVKGQTYLAYMHVSTEPAENILYILDLNKGDNLEESFTQLAASTFEDEVVYSLMLGDAANGNASVGLDIVPVGDDVRIMAYAAGNGFVMQEFTAEELQALPLPFMETFAGLGEETPEDWIPEGWLNVDADGDTHSWYWDDYLDEETGDYETYMLSRSWLEDDGPLTPDNWLITPAIYFEEVGEEENIELKFNIAPTAGTPEFRLERYEVLISTTDTEPESFTMLWEETFTEDDANWEWQERVLDLTEYEGETVHIAFRHYGSTNMDRVALESMSVEVVPEAALADLTLNVKMRVWAESEIFDPAEDFVDVAGTFNEWGDGEELVLEGLEDEDLTYTITIPDLEVGETYNFKFRINGSWDDETAEFPGGGPEREVTIAETDNEYTYWYNDDEPSNVSELAETGLTIFPNPASDQVTIHSEESIKQIVVSDLTGKTIQQFAVNSHESQLDVSSFNNGIYLISIVTENGVSVSKIQVQK